jgi:hypothetical protein
VSRRVVGNGESEGEEGNDDDNEKMLLGLAGRGKDGFFRLGEQEKQQTVPSITLALLQEDSSVNKMNNFPMQGKFLR